MIRIENNLPELKAFADAQAGRALEMYQLAKRIHQIIEEMQDHMKCGNCPTKQNGSRFIKKALNEYSDLLDETAA